MAYLNDFVVSANRDQRQDNRKFVNANAYTITYAPYIAYPGSTISGNKLSPESSANANLTDSIQSGFTGKNAQTVLVVGIGMALLVGAAYVYLK